jgi:hypothetical protein
MRPMCVCFVHQLCPCSYYQGDPFSTTVVGDICRIIRKERRKRLGKRKKAFETEAQITTEKSDQTFRGLARFVPQLRLSVSGAHVNCLGKCTIFWVP